MASFEMLYGRRCRTPIFWNEIGERQIFVPDIIQDTEKQVRLVREKTSKWLSHARRVTQIIGGGS
jgi:hypothetical protein